MVMYMSLKWFLEQDLGSMIVGNSGRVIGRDIQGPT